MLATPLASDPRWTTRSSAMDSPTGSMGLTGVLQTGQTARIIASLLSSDLGMVGGFCDREIERTRQDHRVLIVV